MLLNFAGITTYGSINPYLRKHVLNTLDPHDYLFINGFIIAILLSIYFMYMYLFDIQTIQKSFKNYKQLSFSQIGSLIIIATFTLCSSILLLDVDKHYNTPAINFIIIRSLSFILLFLIGVAVFREVYNIKQIVGIVITAIGVVLMSNVY